MTAEFMLDTDSVSFALRGHGRVGARIVEHPPSQICISAITLAELNFGAERRDSRKLRTLIERFARTIAVMPFDDECSASFGKLASKLVSKGRPIGQSDTLIAAHAIALGVTLVTNNEKHFKHVDGLKIANWV
jgi:tRNA(fMet)-specific endonuclease VapC